MRELEAAGRAWWRRSERARRALARLEVLHENASLFALVTFAAEARSPLVRRAGAAAQKVLWYTRARALPQLDAEFRSRRVWAPREWVHLSPESVARMGEAGSAAAGVLAVCCSHANGYVREQAVRALASTSQENGFEVPFLLMRAADWVPVVRAAAIAAVRARFRPEYGRAFIESLEIVARLRRSGREDTAQLAEEVWEYLRSPVHGPALLASIKSEFWKVKREVFRLGLESNAALDVIRIAKGVPDGIVRLWAARRTRHVAEGADLRALVAQQLKDTFMLVRREALLTIEAKALDAEDSVRRALLDRHGVVRAEARRILGMTPAEAATFYRGCVGAPVRHAALAALATIGSAQDLDLFEEALADLRPRVRRVALRGFVRFSESFPQAVVEHFLADPSPRVAASAWWLLHKQSAHPSVETLWRLWSTPEPAHISHFAGRALRLLTSKWTALRFILGAAVFSLPEDRRRTLWRALEVWIQHYNRTFERPEHGEIEALEKLLECARLPPAMRAEVESILSSWRV